MLTTNASNPHRASSRLAIVVFAMFAIVAASCSGGSDDYEFVEADEPFIAALTDSQNQDPLPGVDSGCAARAVVAGAGGASGFEEKYGITSPQQLLDSDLVPSVEDARRMARGVVACDGLKLVLAADYTKTSGAEAECLAATIDTGDLELLWEQGILRNEEARAEADAKVEAKLDAAREGCAPSAN